MVKKRFSADAPSRAATRFRPLVLFIAIVCTSLALPGISLAARNETVRQSADDGTASRNRSQTGQPAARENSRGTPAPRREKSTYNQNVERWRELPSDEKKELRKRMDQFRNLTPQEQEAYRRRYEKLQEMTPSQRKKIDQRLEKWDTLSPNEKEEIRRQFEE